MTALDIDEYKKYWKDLFKETIALTIWQFLSLENEDVVIW